MEKKEIENRTKMLLTEYWEGKLPVNITKIIENFKIVVKKDMLFGSSGIVSCENGILSCKINVMDPEEKHRYAMSCAIGYSELETNKNNDFSFDVIKDYNENEKNIIWQSIKFAHYLLMPEEAVRKQVEIGKKQGIIPSFSHLYYSKEFKVPEEIVKERFKELNIA